MRLRIYFKIIVNWLNIEIFGSYYGCEVFFLNEVNGLGGIELSLFILSSYYSFFMEFWVGK